MLCVDGEGWYKEENNPARSLRPGDVVAIPAEVKHWHGAKPDSWFSHLAIECPGENTSNEWLEAVTDDVYYSVEEQEDEKIRDSETVLCYSLQKHIGVLPAGQRELVWQAAAMLY